MNRSTVFLSLLTVLAWACAAGFGAGEEDGRLKGGDHGSDSTVRMVEIDGHTITQREFRSYLELAYLSPEVKNKMETLDPAEQGQYYAEVRREALKKLITRHLFLVEAEREYLSGEGARETLNELAEQHMKNILERKGTVVAYRRSLIAQGLTEREIKQMRRDALLVGKFRWDKIYSRIHAAPYEVRRYWEEHRSEFKQESKTVLRQLWVDPEGCENRQQELEKAKRILAEIREGADFAAMCNKYSLDRDTRPGGLHEVARLDDLAGWLREILSNLEPGQVSGVTFAAGSYCIVKLEEIQKERLLSFEEAQGRIVNILENRKRAEAEKRWREKLRKKFRVKYHPAAEKILS